jgi:putative oxidoreductase
MRRLFSIFARGAPGIGLLLLRVTTGSALIYCGLAGLFAPAAFPSAAWRALLLSLGALLFAGLWTPVAALLAVVATIWHIISVPTAWPQSASIAVMAAALTLLGPGAWSIDARLYGWKEITIPARRKPQDVSD